MMHYLQWCICTIFWLPDSSHINKHIHIHNVRWMGGLRKSILHQIHLSTTSTYPGEQLNVCAPDAEKPGEYLSAHTRCNLFLKTFHASTGSQR